MANERGETPPSVAYYTQQRAEMRRFVPASCHRILEIGCGEGGFMRGLRGERPGLTHAVGVEPVAAAAQVAATVFDEVLVNSVEQGLERLQGRSFDCIVCNDVLEHLVDPWAVMAGLRELLAPDGCLVASLPNIRFWPTLNALFLHGEWEYQKSGILDRTHLRFFTRKALRGHFARAGLSLDQVAGINAIRLPWKIRCVNALLGGRFEDTRYLQFACVARPSISTQG
jgi:2-polyprenyl-3-methyl-5-hydroxy-6-metoxy-1,4-benzoquinol methylase